MRNILYQSNVHVQQHLSCSVLQPPLLCTNLVEPRLGVPITQSPTLGSQPGIHHVLAAQVGTAQHLLKHGSFYGVEEVSPPQGHGVEVEEGEEVAQTRGVRGQEVEGYKREI